jgi:hypothetical protein
VTVLYAGPFRPAPPPPKIKRTNLPMNDQLCMISAFRQKRTREREGGGENVVDQFRRLCVCVHFLRSVPPSLFFFFFLCVRFLFFGKISCKKKLTLSDCFDSPPPPHREDPNGGEGDTPTFYKYLSTILLLRRQEQEMERKRQGWIDDVTIGCDRRRCPLLFPSSRLDFDPQIS